MKQRQQCACVRACVYTALKMRDGGLSGPARSGTSNQAEGCFTAERDTLEADKKPIFLSAQNSRQVLYRQHSCPRVAARASKIL